MSGDGNCRSAGSVEAPRTKLLTSIHYQCIDVSSFPRCMATLHCCLLRDIAADALWKLLKAESMEERAMRQRAFGGAAGVLGVPYF